MTSTVPNPLSREHKMKHRIFFLLSAILAGACSEPQTSEEVVKMYKPLGSVQCGGGDITPPEIMRRQLLDANIPVRAVACGNDGGFHASVCGEPDGSINIFAIPKTKESKALTLGFKPLSELPNAKEKPCD
jgi:hypothetical protein